MKNIAFLLMVTFLFSCESNSNSSKKISSNLGSKFDFGEYGDGFYNNEMFGFKINYNTDWHLQSQEELLKLGQVGADLVAGDDPMMKNIIEASQVNVAYLFGIFKYEIGSAVLFNPSLLVIAENVKSVPGVKTGEDYLYHTKKMMERANMDVEIKPGYGKKEFGSESFTTMKLEMGGLGIKITQEYFVKIKNKFCLGFIISYADDEQRDELYEMIDKMEM